MKIDHRYRVHLAARQDGTQPHLAQPWLDVKGKRLIATDGHMLAFVPVELDRGDQTGAVPVAAAKKARWERVTALKNQACVGTTAYGRPKVKFPDVDKVVPKWTADSPGTTTVLLDPRLLVRLARAMGVLEGEGVALTIRHGKKRLASQEAMLVRPDGHTPSNRAIGLLMPRRLPESKGAEKPRAAPNKPKAVRP